MEHNNDVLFALKKHTVLILLSFESMFMSLLLSAAFGMPIVWMSLHLTVAQCCMLLIFSFNKEYFAESCLCCGSWITFRRMKALFCHKSPKWLRNLNRRVSLHERAVLAMMQPDKPKEEKKDDSEKVPEDAPDFVRQLSERPIGSPRASNSKPKESFDSPKPTLAAANVYSLSVQHMLYILY